MGGIGGGSRAQFVRSSRSKNARGVSVESGAEPVAESIGWLDYQSGQASHQEGGAKLEETTHVFLCDYSDDIASLDEEGLSLLCGGRRYEVLLIDDPMGMHDHIEVMLKYLGA